MPLIFMIRSHYRLIFLVRAKLRIGPYHKCESVRDIKALADPHRRPFGAMSSLTISIPSLASSASFAFIATVPAGCWYHPGSSS